MNANALSIRVLIRSLKSAKKEMRMLKGILSEFQQDYDVAQSEEDLSVGLHERYSNRIAEVYNRYKELESRVQGLSLS